MTQKSQAKVDSRLVGDSVPPDTQRVGIETVEMKRRGVQHIAELRDELGGERHEIGRCASDHNESLRIDP